MVQGLWWFSCASEWTSMPTLRLSPAATVQSLEKVLHQALLKSSAPTGAAWAACSLALTVRLTGAVKTAPTGSV